MNRLIKLFLLQTILATVVAIPVYFYLRSDYREFQVKKQIALQVPTEIGAVCGDGWYSGSTGSGTCSHHGGVKYWGTELRQIAQTNWVNNNYLFFFILGAGLIGWYAFGARAIRLSRPEAGQSSAANRLQRQCCSESLAQGLRLCAICGATVDVNETNRRQPAVSPSTTYVLMTATIFLTVGLALVSLVYLRTRQNPQVAVTPAVTSSPTPSPSPAGSPTPAATATPKPAPTTKPEDDLESGLIQPTDPLEDAIRSAKEKVTPAPDPYIVPSRERTVSSPTPRPTIYTESLVYASDILVPRYSKSEERRVYRFHLSQTARVKGNFSARGNISVYITGGNYSSNGAISSDSIDVSLAAGTYEVIVSARETVSFSVHLTAYYDQ